MRLTHCIATSAVGHRLARLVQWGLRQARYMGRHKTAAQLYLTATVDHLTRILATTWLRPAGLRWLSALPQA